MNAEQLRTWLLEHIQPSYEQAYGRRLDKNVMNVSSLVAGTKSYLYHYQTRKNNPWSATGKPNPFLLRGSAVHALVNHKLNDLDMHELTWIIPWTWADGVTKDIVLLGHWDNMLPIPNELILVDWKTTDQADITKNGFLLRAKRQVGTYREILRLKTGIKYQCFVVILHCNGEKFLIEDIDPHELTETEIVQGFDYVKQTAMNVAREMDAQGVI